MRQRPALPPVIIIGMHRSGTSILSRLLDRCGLFMGHSLNADHEARFFVGENEWLLAASGGRWDTPTAINALLSHPEGMALTTRYLRLRMSSVAAARYLGLRRYFRTGGLQNADFMWGWKDPRTTVTLPVWLELFPAARVIHVVRSGVDVAFSLARREKRGLAVAAERLDRYHLLYGMRAKRGWFGLSPRVARLEEGFGLWETYLDFAQRHTANIPGSVIEVRYEDIVRDPQAHLEELLAFCGLQATHETISSAAKMVSSGSRLANMNSKDYRAFFSTVRQSHWMRHYGYDHDLPPGSAGSR